MSHKSIATAFLAMESLAVLLIGASRTLADEPKTSFKFAFSAREIPPGYTRVSPTTMYSKDSGYGFEPGSMVIEPQLSNFCLGETPFYFSVAVPEGNYKMTATLGDNEEESNTTIKAELRRLMVENVATRSGHCETRTFIVNVRTPKISTGGDVRLKEREKTSEARAWDDKLTLEFDGRSPCLCTLEIEPIDNIPTVYLLGDSTVCDQPEEPWNSWGQMLPRFFKPEVAIANHAESGESLRGSLGAKRLEKVLSMMKPGDYFSSSSATTI